MFFNKKRVYDIITNWLNEDVMTQRSVRKLTHSFMGEHHDKLGWDITPLNAMHHYEVWIFCQFYLDENQNVTKFEIKIGGIVHTYTSIIVTPEHIDFFKVKSYTFPLSEEIMRKLYQRFHINLIANEIICSKEYCDTDEAFNSLFERNNEEDNNND